MPTIKETNLKIDALYNGWVKDFRPLFRAGENLKRVMFKRIFGTGTTGGKNTAMQDLPTTPYSTTPIYVDPKSLRNAPASFKVGKPTLDSKGKTKKGKPIKSLYFAGGYAELKSKTSAKLPLQLTGKLAGGFLKSDVVKDGLKVKVVIPDSEIDKSEGLEDKYGIIFQPAEQEELDFLKKHGEFIVEQINEMLK